MKRKRSGGVELSVSKPVNTIGLEILDTLGSYTGRAADPLEKPVQDADDL